jgi:hypothetical protein
MNLVNFGSMKDQVRLFDYIMLSFNICWSFTIIFLLFVNETVKENIPNFIALLGIDIVILCRFAKIDYGQYPFVSYIRKICN